MGYSQLGATWLVEYSASYIQLMNMVLFLSINGCGKTGMISIVWVEPDPMQTSQRLALLKALGLLAGVEILMPQRYQ